MRKISIFLLLVFFSALSLEQGHTQREAYLIGRGDVLNLSIYAGGNEEQNTDLTVSDQGMVQVPFIGFLKAEGVTIRQLEEMIHRPLAEDYFVDPQVNLRIEEYHSLQYYLSGAVKNPGLFEMTARASIMELIAKAGGIAENCGNVAFILRGKASGGSGDGTETEDPANAQKPMKIDLRRLLDQGDMTQNLILQSGDVVYFPTQSAQDVAESKIYVEGEVKEPGAFDYQEGITALGACIMAGGFKKFAAPNRTRIIRQNGDKVEVIKIDLLHVQKGEISDIEMKPGDRIHIPETWL